MTRKILSFKEENGLYVCRTSDTGTTYLTKSQFLQAKLEEKLEEIDPSLVDELAEFIKFAIEEAVDDALAEEA